MNETNEGRSIIFIITAVRRPQTEDLRPQHTDSDTVLRDSVSESQCGASRRHRHEPASMCAGDSRSLSSGRVVLQHKLWRARVV